MIAKRIGAGLLAVMLILGALVVRDRVIEDDGAGATSGDDSDEGDDDDRPAEVLYCVSELRDTCRAIEAELDSIEVRTATAGSTLDEIAAADPSGAMWLTMAPLPEMLAILRQSGSLDPIEFSATPLASSPLALVTRPDSSEALVAGCGDPVDLACLSDQADLAPTFAGLDTASGMLAVAAAASAFGGEALDVNDPRFTVWARTLKTAGASSLSGGTAIQTIQTRPTFGIAVGAEAELAEAQRPRFVVLGPARPIQYDVVLMVPSGVEVPPQLAPVAVESLTSNGWQPAGADATATGLPSPGVILAVRDIWEDLR